MAGHRRQRLAGLVLAGAVASLSIASPVAASNATPPPAQASSSTDDRRDVMFVGNNYDGTVSVIDAGTFNKRGRIDVIPDREQRLAEMTLDERAAYLAVRQSAGHDQYADDMQVSPDGRVLYVSRPSFADVVAFDLNTHEMLWRVEVSGYRSDHLALSPDGDRLLVSATTANQVDVIDTRRARIVDSFPTGDFPHGNHYSPDGERVYNGSIGRVITPDHPAAGALKGERRLTIADADTMAVQRTIEFERGIRPFVIVPGQRIMYIQLSFLHGFVEYSLDQERILRTVHLPKSEEAEDMDREDYPLDSAHHGLAMSGDGAKLCDAGTVSDYVAILSRPALTVDRIVPVGDQPYWATTSMDGRYCFVSNSKSDTVSVISYERAEEVIRIPVGEHPQRIRTASVPQRVLGN